MAKGNRAAQGNGVEVARLTVKVSPDTKNFGSELKRNLQRLKDTVHEISVSIDADVDNFRRTIKQATTGLRADVSLDVDRTKFRQQTEAAAKTLKPRVEVDVDVRRGAIGRLIDKLSNIKGPDFGSGVNGMGIAAIAAGAFALAAPAMGILTSAALTLPGLLAAVATPIGAITLGLDGIKKSAERLKEPFEHLKASMNAVNEAAFGPVFDKIGTLFPALERSLPSVSQGVADVASSIAGVLTNPVGLERIETTIRNIGSAISQAAPGFGSFTDGITTLAKEFSDKLPDLSSWFNDTMADFQSWVQKITRPDWFTGDSLLDRAFDGLGGTLKTILDTLGGMASAGMKFFQDPLKINDFNNALKGVGDSLTRIVELSDSLNDGNLFSSILPTGPTLKGGFDWESFKADITKPFTSDDAGWRDIWAGMKTAWEETKTSFLQSMNVVKTVASTMWDGVAARASEAWNGATAAVQGAVGAVQNTVAGIGSSISSVWNGVSSAASAAWNGVVGTVQSSVSQILQQVSEIPGQIKSFFADAGSWLVEAGRNVVQGLINGIRSMIGSAAAAAKEIAASVAGAVTGFLGIKSPSRLFMSYGEFTAQGFGIGMENGFGPVLDQAKGIAGQIADAFASGGDPTEILKGFNPEEVDRMNKVLGFDSKMRAAQARALEYQAKITGSDALKEQAQKLRMLNDEIGLQKDMLSLAQEYTSLQGNTGGLGGDNPLVEAAAGMMAAPVNFSKATASQFMSDLGISGNGLISRAVTEGIQYIFQIGSVDQAMDIKQREDSKRARARMRG